MKFQITFTEKESMVLANLMHKFDFEGNMRKVDLTKNTAKETPRDTLNILDCVKIVVKLQSISKVMRN